MEQFDNICEVQSDKASVTITSRYDGKIVKLYHKIDDTALVGNPLVDFDVQDEAGDSDDSSSSSSSSSSDEEAKPKEQAKETASCAGTGSQKVLTTPAVRRIAIENKVDLTKVTPTGKFGRLLKGDLLEYLNIIPPGTVKPHPTLVNQSPAATRTVKPMVPGEVRVEALKGVRKAMLKAMTESLVSI